MEERKGNTEGAENKSVEKLRKSNERIYKWTILLLVLVIGVLTYFLVTETKDLKEEVVLTQDQNTELKFELDSLVGEYTHVKHQYDSVLTDKDEVIQEKTREIEKLIAQQADYYRIRRQLNLLRDITQNYVREIDSLHTENKVLKAENIKMQDEIQRVTQQTETLSQTKTELEEQVEKAAGLRAFRLSATAIRLYGFRNRERETDKARRTDMIKICFTIAENPIAPAGEKNVYIRISGPDTEILRISDDDAYSFVYGSDTLQYSVKESFDYQNNNIDMCLYWDKSEDYEEGQYLISVFTDEDFLGETLLNLN